MPSPQPDQQQRIAPSTTYEVPGSPDQYRFVLRGADLVLIDENNQEHVFLFVGNIMSLDGNVNMTFGDGETLNSQDLFTRSEMEDMEQFDHESTEWEVESRFSNPVEPEDAEGNTEDGTGLLPPAEQNDEIPAQAEGGGPKDPTDELLELQRRLINELSEKGQEDGGQSTDIGMDSSSSSPESNEEQADPDQDQEPEDNDGDGPTEYTGSGNTSSDSPTIKLTEATDSGLKEGYTTNNQQPAFEGTSAPGSTVEIWINGDKADSVTADADGHFTSEATINLNGGEYLLYAKTVYSGGEEFKSTVHELTIDLEAPDLPTMELSSSSNTSTILDGNLYTNDTTPSLHGTGGDPNSTVTLYISLDDGTSYTELDTIDVGSDGSWSYTLTSDQALGDGDYIFRLSSTDDAGNDASGYTFLDDIVVKTDNPTSSLSLSSASDSMDADAGGTPGDRVTNAETLVLVADASDDTTGVEIFMVGDGAYISLGQATKSGDDWVFTVQNADIPTVNPNHSYRFVAQATDVAGNVEAMQSKYGLEVVIDRTPEEVAPHFDDLDGTSDTTDSAGLLGTTDDGYTNANSISLNGSAGADKPVDIYLSVDGGDRILISDGVLRTDAMGHWTYSYDVSAYGISGTQNLVFTAEILDPAANVTSTTLTVDVDHTDPDIPTIGMVNAQGTVESDIDEIVATVRNTNAVLEGVITEGSDDLILTVYAVDGNGVRTAIADNMPGGATGTVIVSDNGNGTYSWSYDYGPIADGQSYTFVVTAEDAAGNFSTRDSRTLVIHADTSINVPTLELDSSTDTEGGPSGSVGDDYTGFVDGDPDNPLEFKVSGDDNSTITVYLLDASAPGAAAIISGGVTIGTGVLVGVSEQDINDAWPLVSFDASDYAGTTTNLTFVAVSEDKAGNSAYFEYTVTLDDTDPTAGPIDLDSADDLGVSATDNITSAKEIVLTGTLTEGADAVKVTIYDNGVELGEATISNGSWTYTIGDENSADAADYISEGGHSYTAVVEDNAGNQTTLDALDVTIDRSISDPTFELTSGVGSSDTGRVTDDGITNAASLLFNGTSDAGDTVSVHRVIGGVDTVIDTFEAGAASWTYTVDNSFITADGDYSFYITTSDVAGNANSSQASAVDVTIDRSTDTPGTPDLDSGSDSSYTDGSFTAGTTDSDDITNATTLTITGDVEAGGVEACSVVNLYIQGEADPVGSVTVGAEGTTWSITVNNADIPADGDYDFYVRYVDLAGNESDPSSNLTVTIDRDVPDQPTITMDGSDGTDFFIHGTDYYTNDVTPTFTLTGLEVGTTLNVKVDNAAVQTIVVTDATMSFAPDAFAVTDADGTVHTVTVVAVDSAGNASPQAEFSFTLDTTAEAISGVQLTAGSDSGESATDDYTNVTTPTIEGTAEANAAITVILKDSGGNTVFTDNTVMADGSGNWTATVTDGSALSDGETYTVEVTATDYAGNEATDSSYTFELDTSIQAVGLHMVEDPANDTGEAADDQYTGNQTPEFTWTAGEDLTATITLYNGNDVELGSYTVDSPTGANDWTVPFSLVDGDYKITATFVDQAGNTVLTDNGAVVTESVDFTIDHSISKPTFELCTTGADDSDTGRIGDDGVTGAGDLIFHGTSDVGDTVTVYRGSTVVGTFVAASTNWDFTVAESDAPEGTFNFYVTTEDQAGNTDSSTPEAITIDRSVNTPGEVDLTDASDSFYADGAFTAGTTNEDNITSATSLTFTGDVEAAGVEANSVVYLYIDGVADPVGQTTVGSLGSTWSITIDASGLGDADYDFYVRYVDLAGNESDPSAVLPVTIDRMDPANPIIAIDGSEGTDYFIDNGEYYVQEVDPTFTLSNLEVGTYLNVKMDGSSVQTLLVDNGSMAFDPADFALDGTDDGEHTITVVAVDSAGNASQEVEFTFNLDTVAEGISGVKLTDETNSGADDDAITNVTTPIITGLAEANATVEVEIFDGATSVFTTTVTANSNGRWNADISDVNGDSVLPDDGTYSVHVTATDQANNVSTDDSYSFTLDTTINEVGFHMVEESANDTGFTDDDQYTKNRNPEFAWECDEDLTVTISIYDDNGDLVNSYTEDSPAGENTWTVPGGTPLDDGDYTVTATFTDAAGNVLSQDINGDPIESVDLTVDTLAPELTVGLTDGSDSGTKGDWLTNDEAVTAGLSLTGDGENGSRIYVYVNDMSNPVTDPVSGNDYLTVSGDTWTFDLSALDIGSGLNAGDNSIMVVAEDQAGNKTVLTETLEIDSDVVPVGHILLDDDSNSGFKTDFITNDTTPTLYGYTEGNATVVLTVENEGGDVTDVATVTADETGYWSVDVPAGILTADGNYTFTADITDEAGNEATTSRVLTIDTDLEAPTITMDVDSYGTFNGTDSDFITADTTPEFTITTEVDTKLEIYRDDVLIHTVALADNDVNGVLSYSESELGEGTYTYRFVSTDSAGNTSQTTQVVDIDPTYDPADLTVALHSDYDSGVSDSDGLTNEPRPVFSGTAEAGSKVRIYFSDRYGTEAEAQASAVGASYETEMTLASDDTDWEYVPSALADDGSADGFYKVTVVSEDAAGNQQTTTTVMELDTTPPTPTPTFELTTEGDNTIVSATQTTDNTPGFAGIAEPGSTVSITIRAFGSSDAALVAEATADGSGNWFYQVENAQSLADGSYNVSITNSDDAGNVSEGLAEFQITGDTPAAPTIGLDSADDTNIDTDGVTSQNTNLTLTGIAQSYADVVLYVTDASDTACENGTALMTVEAGGNGVWKADLAGTVADGTYYYYVSSEYSPGNVYTSSLCTLEVDSATITPTLELLDDTGVADEWLDPAPNTTDSDWESSNATITGTVDEGATVVITATNTATSAVTTVTIDPENLTKVNDEWTYAHDLSGLGDGEFEVQVTTTDLAGNTASSAVQTMYFDSQTVKPTVDLPTAQDTELSVDGDGHILLANGNAAGPAMESHLPADFVSTMADGYTQEDHLVLTGTAEAGALVRIIIYKDGNDFPSPAVFVAAADGTWSYDTGELDDGMYTFEVTTTDMAGNERNADTLNVYVDADATRGPAIALHDGIDYTNDTPDTTPTFTLYGDSDSVWMLYLDDQEDPIATGTFNEATSYRSITPGVTEGVDMLEANVEHTFVLVTVDRAGNVAVSGQFNFEIDTIAPVQQDDPVSVTGTSNIVPADGSDPMEIYTSDDDPTITIRVEAGTQARMTGFGDGEWVTDTDGDGLITFTVPDNAIVDEGAHSVTVEFRDAAQNLDAAENLDFVLVVDTSKPATTIDLDSTYDLGFSDSDAITSGDQLVLSGDILELGLGQDVGDFTTAIDDYSVTVLNTTTGLSEIIGSDDITLNGDGTWTLTYGVDGTPLDSGHYQATLTASDMAGNTHSSTTEFDVLNETLDTPEPTLMALGNTGYYLLSQSEYLPEGTDYSQYKYELTYYGKDADGNDISLSMGEQSFNNSGGIEEVINPTLHDTYDYVGIKVIDYAGNESTPSFTDVDTTDVSFSAEVESSATVASMAVTITGDTDNNGIDDVSLTTAGVEIDADGNWTWDFAGTLAEGDYTLHFEGFEGANGTGNSVGGEFTYDFSVLADEMNLASDSQDFSAGEEDLGSSGDPGGGGGGGGDTVEIDATVHVDYVEGSVS